MPYPKTTKAVHIGDLHFWHISLNPWNYRGKRFLGMGNLIVNRRRKFRRELGSLIVERVREIDPAWALFSGDLSTTALGAEFQQALKVFRPLEKTLAGGLRVVPGNHDRYSPSDIRDKRFEQFLGNWCGKEHRWPWFERLAEDLWCVGIDGTTSNGLGSFGRIRPATLESLRNWWKQARGRVKALWVVCHFPPEEPLEAPSHGAGVTLRNDSDLVEVLGSFDIPVFFMHGHLHYRWLYRSPTAPNVVYVNAGAPLMRHGSHAPDLGFFELDWDGEQTRVTMHTGELANFEWSSAAVELPGASEYKNLQDRAEKFE